MQGPAEKLVDVVASDALVRVDVDELDPSVGQRLALDPHGDDVIDPGEGASVGVAEKSVSWLFSRNPLVMWNEPMLDSTVVVALSTLPCASTIVNWFVPCST